MLSYTAYLYHSSIYWAFQTLWKTIIFLAPISLVQAGVIESLEEWGIHVVVVVSDQKNGGAAVPTNKTTKTKSTTKTTTTTPPKCTLTVYDRRFFKEMAVGASIALGEAYTNQKIDCTDLVQLVVCLAGKKTKDSVVFRIMIHLRNNYVTAHNLQTKGRHSLAVADIHYNLGNDLYRLMLDESMCYSCGYWNDKVKDDDDLKQAQLEKMDLIARKLKLQPGMRCLDIGCGFGSMAKHLATKYGVTVVGYNISTEQVAYARESCRGLPNVEFVQDDYRNAAQSGRFDRVYSIGFFEHVGRNNYQEYFTLVESCLVDDGLHLVHAITMRDSCLPRTDDWLNKYIFPGGEIPHPQDYFTYSADLLAVEDVHSLSVSYVKTLRVWKANFIKNWPQLEERYGPMMDGKFYRMWIFYLDMCIGSFAGRVIHLYQVVHSKQGLKPGAPCPGYESVR